MRMPHVFIIALFIIAATAFAVVAAKDEDAAQGAGKPLANQSYGRCVSMAAVLKNTCYNGVSGQRGMCRTAAADQTEPKQAAAQCESGYKQVKQACTADFKAAKRECAKIKHNFLETLGSSLK